MPNTPFHHPYRIDAPTLARAAAAPGSARLLGSNQLPETVRFLSVDPAVFTHVYLLLGEHPQRFLSDLSLYISTIRTFFERADVNGGVNVPSGANADSKRRLSEDLGVALASYFMVGTFELMWESISQIPQNSKLSKKRPDFQGYTPSNRRYLFEAKGTTKLTKIEPTLSKAISQVKGYPEQAEAKLAVVSYLSADERFFPSTSFVVDPPALPDEVKPDLETSRLLHFEKVLQFSGLSQTAKSYVSALSARLREQHRVEQGNTESAVRNQRLNTQIRELQDQFSAESSQQAGIERLSFHNIEFIGRLFSEAGLKVFFGTARTALEAGIGFQQPAEKLETRVITNESEIVSEFSDGTIFRVLSHGGKNR